MAVKRVPNMPHNNGEKNMASGRPNGNNRIKRMPETANRNQAANARGNVGARMNIAEQTPSRRRSAKEAKRIDPNSPEIKRSAKRAQGYKIKKKKKGVSKTFIARMIMFALVFAVISGIVSLLFYVSLIQVDEPKFSSLKLVLCLEHEVEETKPVSVSLENYLVDDELFVNMTAISEKFGFVIAGDTKAVRFITNDETVESVKFTIGSLFAEVNGTEVRLEGKPFWSEEGKLFVPASFFEEYVNGIQITVNEEKRVLTVVRETQRNEAGRFDECAVDFKLKRVADSASISEFDLSAEIKAKCYYATISPDMNLQG